MLWKKIFACSACITVLVLLFAGGCTEAVSDGPGPEVAAEMALKFAPDEMATYRLTTRAEKSVEFEGPMAKDPQFMGGVTGNRIEMTFTQRIRSVDEEGNGVAEITIEDLKYSSTQKNKHGLDFDSSREQDSGNPLAKLVGQGYTITITPAGEILEVSDTAGTLSVVKGLDAASQAAMALLKSSTIKERHGVLHLPAKERSLLHPSEKWSSMKSYDFKMMGPKAYEKIYTIEQIIDRDSRKVATVGMNAIPGSQSAGAAEQDTSALSKMLDEKGTYTGELKFDATTGSIESYREKLELEWIMVDPGAGGTEAAANAIRMGAMHLYDLQRID